MKGVPIGKWQKQRVRHLYFNRHLAMKKVAEEEGLSVGVVHKIIHERNRKARSCGDYPRTEKQKEWTKTLCKMNLGRKMSEETKRTISEAKRLKGIGHKKRRADGYVAVYYPTHPRATRDGYIMEHILVMEGEIGRHLNENECVHHINRIRHDNRKENLQVMTKSEHMSMHMKERHAKRRNDLSTQ